MSPAPQRGQSSGAAHPLLASFLNLRWKLTFSASMAIVGAVLIGGCIALAIYTAQEQRVLREPWFPEALHAELQVLSWRLRPSVVAEPPVRADIQRWIQERTRDGSFDIHLGGEGVQREGVTAEFRVGLQSLTVRDRTGAELASFRQEKTPSSAPEPPELSKVLEAALANVRDPKALARRTSTGDVVVGVPFVDDRGQVAGTVVAVAHAAPASMKQLARRFLELPRIALEIFPYAVLVGLLLGWMFSRSLVRRVRHLGTAAEAWSEGDLTRRVGDRSADELGELGRDLDRMATELSNLLKTRQELAAVDERNHLARELHDTVKQQVFSLSLLLGSVESRLDDDGEQARAHLKEARALAQLAGRELNALILQLRPAALDDKGLAPALREHVATWSEETGVSAELHVQGERSLPLDLELDVFRVAQEALVNVARHAGATNVDLHLEVGPAGGELTLRVTDDGRGFEPGSSSGGFGLSGMSERMESRGGHLEMRSTPGEGTTVMARVPLHETTMADEEAP
ncbi:MAG: histidine kinase [Acidobacteriota bacterium]